MNCLRKQRARKTAATDIDLIPVMNLFVTLIPFLLLGATFYHVGVIPAAIPAAHAAAPDDAEDEEPPVEVVVQLRVTEAALELRAECDRLDQETLDAMSASLDWSAGADDKTLRALSSALHAIKRQYEHSEKLVLTPEVPLRYQDVVRLLDATRSLSLADEVDGTERSVPLFPVVVLSRDAAGEAVGQVP